MPSFDIPTLHRRFSELECKIERATTILIRVQHLLNRYPNSHAIYECLYLVSLRLDDYLENVQIALQNVSDQLECFLDN